MSGLDFKAGLAKRHASELANAQRNYHQRAGSVSKWYYVFIE